MPKGKHLNKTSTEKENFRFLKIFIISLLLILTYFLFQIYKNKLPTAYSSDNSSTNSIIDEIEEIYEPTEKVEIETVLTVKGAEHLEITGVHINSDNPELSTVTAKLKNNSDQSYENINLRISLFDKDNNEITFLDYKIDKIEANGESSTFAALKRDLSNCENYSIALKSSN